MAALDTPPTLRAVADLDVEAAHHGAHRRKVFLILRRRAGHVDRAAAVGTGCRHRRRQRLVDPPLGTGGAPAGHSAHRAAGRDGRRDPAARERFAITRPPPPCSARTKSPVHVWGFSFQPSRRQLARRL